MARGGQPGTRMDPHCVVWELGLETLISFRKHGTNCRRGEGDDDDAVGRVVFFRARSMATSVRECVVVFESVFFSS